MKNKKPIIFIALLFVFCIVVGGTIAYYMSSDTFSNAFNTGKYGVTTQEVFESPDNWTPGTTTPKNVHVTNNEDTPVAVRIKLEESWKDSNGDPLPLKDANDNYAAIINYSSNYNSNWINLNNSETTNTRTQMFYYYKALSKNETTEDLIKSVTFNPNVVIDKDRNCDTVDGVTTCLTEYKDYSGGTYQLKITVETCQYDKYADIWGVNPNITQDVNEPEEMYMTLRPRATLSTRTSTYVASQSGIDYTQNSSDTNGKGLYVLGGTENNQYPIMYYRGNVNNNNILFANKCWKAVRTTSTGGTRMIYNGDVSVLHEGLPVNEYANVSSNVDGVFTYNSIGTMWEGTVTQNSIIEFSFSVPTGNDYLISIIGYTSRSSGVNIYKNGIYVDGKSSAYGNPLLYTYVLGSLTNEDQIKLTLNGTQYSAYPIYYYIQVYHSDSEEKKMCLENTKNYITTTAYNSYVSNWSPEQISFMYGKPYNQVNDNASSYSNYYFGSSYIYENGVYELVDTQLGYDATHKYSCMALSPDTTCSTIRRFTGLYIYIDFENGDDIDSIYHNIHPNTVGSYLNSWYESNLSSYTNYIEDSVYCNDRRGNSALYGNYDAYYRVQQGTIDMTCQKNDSFTVSNSDGNEALTYPIGLLTVEELMLAGLSKTTANANNYLRSFTSYWTMTPESYSKDNYGFMYTAYLTGKIDSNRVNSSEGVRPVITLKRTSKIVSGNGTQTNPYIVGNN